MLVGAYPLLENVTVYAPGGRFVSAYVPSAPAVVLAFPAPVAATPTVPTAGVGVRPCGADSTLPMIAPTPGSSARSTCTGVAGVAGTWTTRAGNPGKLAPPPHTPARTPSVRK